MATSYLPDWVGPDNYKTLLFKDYLFRKSLKVTAIHTSGGVTPQLSLSMLLAILLNTASRFPNIFRTIFCTPSGDLTYWNWLSATTLFVAIPSLTVFFLAQRYFV